MSVLDNLSGFEFEDVVEDVFRNLGYENVHAHALLYFDIEGDW
jgi:hypothetical protein